ncbi:MAG: hypothetical protein FWE19_08645 [Oscillospiraceae bacterium]|nr:hypothetical protein [Oscillospiraceae bacterium]
MNLKKQTVALIILAVIVATFSILHAFTEVSLDAIFGFIISFIIRLYIVIIAVAVLLFLASRIVRRMRSKIDKTMLILWEECDPERAAREIIRHIDGTSARNKQVRDIGKNNLSVVYFSVGEFDKAIETLESITLDIEKQGEVASTNAFVRYNLALNYIGKGELWIAAPHIESLRGYRETAKAGMAKGRRDMQQMYAMLEELIAGLEAVAAIKEGKGESVLAFFELALSKANTRYNKVYAHFHLAAIYEQMGDTQKQREHLEYVAENGNLLDMVRVAREKLGLV